MLGTFKIVYSWMWNYLTLTFLSISGFSNKLNDGGAGGGISRYTSPLEGRLGSPPPPVNPLFKGVSTTSSSSSPALSATHEKWTS